MIQANELRIGNLSQSKRGQILTFIGRTPINQNLYWTNESGLIIDNNDILPIQLTEEWLVRFGFKKSDKYGYFLSPHKDSCSDSCFTRLCFFLEEMDFIVNSNDYDGWYVHCEHVHQLQNLYFALIGKELKLNDK